MWGGKAGGGYVVLLLVFFVWLVLGFVLFCGLFGFF